MSAERLREAAALMRERAEAAFKDGARDLWTDLPAMDPENEGWIVCEQRQPDVDWDTTVARLPYDYEGHMARHIASWHPAVALAVAGVLDALAQRAEDIVDATPTAEFGERVARNSLPGYAPALAVADAYLADP